MATKDVTCRTCGGTGEWKRICPRCMGSGIFVRGGRGYKQEPIRDACPRCDGFGDIDHSQCRRCEGTGVYPPTEENQRIREEQQATARAARTVTARTSQQRGGYTPRPQPAPHPRSAPATPSHQGTGFFGKLAVGVGGILTFMFVAGILVAIGSASAGHSSDESFVVKTYPVTVNYDLSVEEAVELGRYDSVISGSFSSNLFRKKRGGTAEIMIELISLGRLTSTGEVVQELDKMGYRPADLHELLALGQNYPYVQREVSVVAVGSIGNRNRYGSIAYVPYLSTSMYDSAQRILWITWANNIAATYRNRLSATILFAAVRK